MGARILRFGGEKPALPQDDDPVLGGLLCRDNDLETQYARSLFIMDDVKDIIKAAVFELLAEIFPK